MKAYAVIGAAFGDEGKGLMTDYLAAKYTEDALVVRCNGGAQAGHTVQTPDHKRHVCKHFGSGTLAGSPTFLSEFFICNPLLFQSEFQQLEKLHLEPEVFLHPNAIVTTPYDMMINQILEEFRNEKKHGSCGVGINETVERNLHPEFAIQVHELQDREKLIEKLDAIEYHWVKSRLLSLGVTEISTVWQTRLSSAGVRNYFLNQIDFFLEHCRITDNNILKKFSAVIFEGAQGLLLDEVKGFFPHVTRSATGLKNVVMVAKSVGITSLEVFYMTRSYLTRHGSGPLPFELSQLPYQRIVDQTNVRNVYQGSLRFAWLNLDLLQLAIYSDLADVQDSIEIIPHLLVSCMDQLDSTVRFIRQNEVVTINNTGLLTEIKKAFPHFKIWSSCGPTRENIYETIDSPESKKFYIQRESVRV
jgi:adenylosuccinate synthase